MNTVTIVGRVGRDAADGFKAFESGRSKYTYSVAVNRWDTKTKSQVTDWFNVDQWFNENDEGRSNFVANYVKKGREIAIDGTIASRKWQDKTTGEEKETYYIVANDIKLLGSQKDVENVM